jgi:hypothetical protein
MKNDTKSAPTHSVVTMEAKNCLLPAKKCRATIIGVITHCAVIDFTQRVQASLFLAPCCFHYSHPCHQFPVNILANERQKNMQIIG